MLGEALRRPGTLLLQSVTQLDDHYGGTDKERSRFQRAQEQIMRGAMNARAMAGRGYAAGMRSMQRMQDKPPLCWRILYKAYHNYGMKHVVLIAVFLLYTAMGAAAFVLLESGLQEQKKEEHIRTLTDRRERRIDELMVRLFNNSHYLIYIKASVTERVRDELTRTLSSYEGELGVRWNEMKMNWDYWNALLFAGSLITTIGYGHVFPVTAAGKILTMVYASFGIPLVLLVLQDFGKMLTMMMKYPWFQLKRLARRCFRCCTKQPLHVMRAIEAQELRDIDVFDLPIIVGIALVIAWVLVCSLLFYRLTPNADFDMLTSFYFFYTSLSTIGLGDVMPGPTYVLVIMFGFIMVGLSLVSMVVNLLQARMRKTYEAGSQEDRNCNKDHGTSLGIMQCFEDEHSSPPEEKIVITTESRATQTGLSLPAIRQVVLRSDGVHWVEKGGHRSPDESQKTIVMQTCSKPVTTLVEMESSLAVCEDLGEYNRDESESEEEEDEPHEGAFMLAREEDTFSDNAHHHAH